jgi:hypothetical protein
MVTFYPIKEYIQNYVTRNVFATYTRTLLVRCVNYAEVCKSRERICFINKNGKLVKCLDQFSHNKQKAPKVKLTARYGGGGFFKR